MASATKEKKYDIDDYNVNDYLAPSVQSFNIGVWSMVPMMNSEEIDSEGRDTLATAAKKEYSCRVCENRVRRLALFLRPEGSKLRPVLCFPHQNRTNYQTHLYKKAELLANEYLATKLSSLKWHVAREDLLYGSTPRQGGPPGYKKEGLPGFPHFHYKIDNAIKELEYWKENTTKEWQDDGGKACNKFQRFELVMNKYFPLMLDLFSKMGMDKDLHLSMCTIADLCKRATYASRQLGPINWFIAAIERVISIKSSWNHLSLTEKIQIIGDTIASSTCNEDDSGYYTITSFHVINLNIASLLKKGKSAEAVVKMMEDRNDPRKYQQSTAAPSLAAVNKARLLLENQKNTIFTQTETAEIPGCAVVSEIRKPDSVSIFDQMTARAKARKTIPNKYSSFHKRIIGISAGRPKVPTTLCELHTMVNQGSITKLELRLDNVHIAWVAHTTLLPKDMSYVRELPTPHFWVFQLNKNYREDHWQACSQIYACITSVRTNFFFFFSNEDFSRMLIKNGYGASNCWLNEFFAPKHHAAKKAIGEFNKKDKVRVPVRGNLAIGVGKSVDNENLVGGSLTFRINGENIVTISTPGKIPSTPEFAVNGYHF